MRMEFGMWNVIAKGYERSQFEFDVKLAEMESATQGKLVVAKGQEQASSKLQQK